MIARLWSARTAPALSDSYLQHFTESVRPELGRVTGFLGATVSTRPAPGSIEILVTTYWASFSAIDTFAGTDREIDAAFADMVQKRRARLERAKADRRGEADGPFRHADAEERLHAANVASSTEK